MCASNDIHYYVVSFFKKYKFDFFTSINTNLHFYSHKYYSAICVTYFSYQSIKKNKRYDASEWHG